MKHFRPILIKAALNGLKVEVGCREFVYEEQNLGRFLTALHDYLLNPEQTEKEFAEKYGFTIGQEPTITEQPVSARPVSLVGMEERSEKKK